jgi:lysophospholipase L1-like esterase
MKMVGKRHVTLIALGDSLTAGFMPLGPLGFCVREHPYTDDLRTMIDAGISRSGADLDYARLNLGVNGDTTRGMLSRFDSQVASLNPNYVIVWGGINDLFGAVRPSDILHDLGRLYERVKEIGAEPIGCTVTSVLGFDPLIQEINELNAMLSIYCEAEDVVLVDLFSAISDALGKMRRRYSSDGVHLNAEGYARIASTMFEEALIPILSSLSTCEA